MPIFKKGNEERGTGNGEWGTENEVNLFHEILHSEQFEGAEFINDNSFLWFLAPANVGTCRLSDHSFGWRIANASILMKFCTLHKLRAVNSMVTIGFCDLWYLSSVRLYFWTNNGKCFTFYEILYSTQSDGGEFNSDNNFLWFSMPIKFDTCQYWHLYLLGHSYRGWWIQWWQ